MSDYPIKRWIAYGCGVIAILLVLGFAIDFGGSAYGRYQARQDANNRAKIATINEKQYDALIAIEKQKAEIKRQEAHGIADAQAIINASLTPLYIQHEAIQAQEDWANSDNNSVIYIPVGSNGVPLVQDVSPQSVPNK